MARTSGPAPNDLLFLSQAFLKGSQKGRDRFVKPVATKPRHIKTRNFPAESSYFCHAARRYRNQHTHMKIRRTTQLCGLSRENCVDLTQDTDDPVVASKGENGKLARKEKNISVISLPMVIVHVDKKLTELRNFRNAQASHPGFFETVNFVRKLQSESVVSLTPDTWLNDNAIFFYLLKEQEISAMQVVSIISEYVSLLHLVTSEILSQGIHVMDPLGSKVLLTSVGDDLSSEAVLDMPSGSTTVFCPVNINNRHWILLVLRRLIKIIEVYDPRGNEHPNIIHKYKVFLGDPACDTT